MKNLIGQVIGGCQMLSVLGEGGMGVIYRAKQLSLEREVAVKVLADRLAGDQNFVERFGREARAIARINHPNILAIYDVGVDTELSIHFMLMELIHGGSLAEILMERGVIEPEEAAGYIRQAAAGLACAQKSEVVHRDIKPENIMLTETNVVKVSDFGLAKEVSSGALTQTDAVMGTPAYMSPEQCDGKRLDARSDIYSLGGTFYKMITGRLPFEADTAMSMMYRHKHEPLTPPHVVVPTVPEYISDVVVRMMAKERDERFATMDEVVAALSSGSNATPRDTGFMLPPEAERTVLYDKNMSVMPTATDSEQASVPRENPILNNAGQSNQKSEAILPDSVRAVSGGAESSTLPSSMQGMFGAASTQADTPEADSHILPPSVQNVLNQEPASVPSPFGVAGGAEPANSLENIMPQAAQNTAPTSPTPETPPDTHRFESPILQNIPEPKSAGGLADVPEIDANRRELERLIAQGDARLRRKDLVGAVGLWRDAQKISDDKRIAERLAEHAEPQANAAKQDAFTAFNEHNYAEALRLFQHAAALNPDDKIVQEKLKETDEKNSRFRESLNQLRQYLASGHMVEAVAAWDELPEDLRDASLAPQISNIKNVILPVARLCDQAEIAAEEYDYDRAMGLYKRAAAVSPDGDRQRRGIRDMERKLERIEEMLQDGFKHNVKENYERAIDAWSSILRIVPNHPKAIKLIVDAHLAMGHAFRLKQGQRGKAISQWRAILKLSPDHNVARALLEEDSSVQSSLAKLGDEAHAAYSEGHYGAAIRAWVKMLDVDPSNKHIKMTMERAKKLLSQKRKRVTVLTLVVVLGLGSVIQITREWLTLSSAKDIGRTDPVLAARKLLLFKGPKVFLGGMMKESYDLFSYQAYLSLSDKLLAMGKHAEVEETLRVAMRHASKDNANLLKKKIVRNKILKLMSLGKKAEAASNLKLAENSYASAKALVKDWQFPKLSAELDSSLEFTKRVLMAIEAESNDSLERAKRFWREAGRIRKESKLVQDSLRRLGGL